MDIKIYENSWGIIPNTQKLIIMLIFTMGGIGQNLQLLSDSSEILCAIRAPHNTYACQIL